MNFFIKQNATLPILKLELISDGRYDFKNFHDELQNSIITFSMEDVETGRKIISCASAFCLPKDTNQGCIHEEYYIAYKFSQRETKKKGKFKGEFTIEMLSDFGNISGTLIVPISEELIINII
jgi:pyruvoyl-dependent arginine decarboxylase (PvlArgDC)